MWLLIVFLIIVFAAVIAVRIVIDNLGFRASQHVLGRAGVGYSDINAAINKKQEGGALKRLFKDYSNYTEQALKDQLFQTIYSLVNKQNGGFMSEKVLKKMSRDKKLDKVKLLNFVRLNILGYKAPNKLAVITIFADDRDEYQMVASVHIRSDGFYINSYNLRKGTAKGF